MKREDARKEIARQEFAKRKSIEEKEREKNKFPPPEWVVLYHHFNGQNLISRILKPKLLGPTHYRYEFSFDYFGRKAYFLALDETLVRGLTDREKIHNFKIGLEYPVAPKIEIILKKKIGILDWFDSLLGRKVDLGGSGLEEKFQWTSNKKREAHKLLPYLHFMRNDKNLPHVTNMEVEPKEGKYRLSYICYEWVKDPEAIKELYKQLAILFDESLKLEEAYKRKQ